MFGWLNYVKYVQQTLDSQIKEMADYRLAICDQCPVRQKDFCSVIQYTTHVITGEKVRGCGCPLLPKTLSPESACPAGKWDSHNSNPL